MLFQYWRRSHHILPKHLFCLPQSTASHPIKAYSNCTTLHLINSHRCTIQTCSQILNKILTIIRYWSRFSLLCNSTVTLEQSIFAVNSVLTVNIHYLSSDEVKVGTTELFHTYLSSNCAVVPWCRGAMVPWCRIAVRRLPACAPYFFTFHKF